VFRVTSSRCCLPHLVHFVFCEHQDYAPGPVLSVASVRVLAPLYEQSQVPIVDWVSVFVLFPEDGSKRLD
jgi:hypothetical protein